MRSAATIAPGPISRPRPKKRNALRSFSSAMVAAMAAHRSQTPARTTRLGRLKRWGRATKIPGSIGIFKGQVRHTRKENSTFVSAVTYFPRFEGLSVT
jgi:hypothetical protein